MRRGLASTRSEAQGLVSAARVLVSGSVADRPARLVSPAEAVHVTGTPDRFVGRGGQKLAAALDHFAVDVAGVDALDAGASTGGFTDCLLQRGARHVTAVDVGRGQLHERLRRDERVTSRERTNVRHLRAGDVAGAPFPVVVADLSFISLRTVAPALLDLTARDGDLIVLVKPQFEAGRAEVARGRGVIHQPEVWARAVVDVGSAFEAGGATMMGAMVSPLRGADGNVEFLAHLATDPTRGTSVLADGAAVETLIAAAAADRCGAQPRKER